MVLGVIDALFGDAAVWFSVPALFGTAYLVIQLLMGQLGGELDLDMDGEMDISTEDGGHDFRVLSLQSIAAFSMGAGWMGLAAYRALDLGPGASALIAAVSGVAVASLMINLLRFMLRLQSSGNIELGRALGATGTVYIEIPPKDKGKGRVTVVLSNRQRELSAVQVGDEPIPSRTRIAVVGIDTATNTVTVEAV